MKKQLLIASLLMLTVSNLNFPVFSAEETNIQTQNSAEKVLPKRERPKLYDANGNKLDAPKGRPPQNFNKNNE